MFGKYAYTYYAMLCVCFCWVCLKSELDFGELIPWLIVVGWAFRCYFNFTVLIQQETYQFLLVIWIIKRNCLHIFIPSSCGVPTWLLRRVTSNCCLLIVKK